MSRYISITFKPLKLLKNLKLDVIQQIEKAFTIYKKQTNDEPHVHHAKLDVH